MVACINVNKFVLCDVTVLIEHLYLFQDIVFIILWSFIGQITNFIGWCYLIERIFELLSILASFWTAVVYILFFDDMNMLTIEKWIKQIHNILSPGFVVLWICFTSQKKNKKKCSISVWILRNNLKRKILLTFRELFRGFIVKSGN